MPAYFKQRLTDGFLVLAMYGNSSVFAYGGNALLAADAVGVYREDSFTVYTTDVNLSAPIRKAAERWGVSGTGTTIEIDHGGVYAIRRGGLLRVDGKAEQIHSAILRGGGLV